MYCETGATPGVSGCSKGDAKATRSTVQALAPDHFSECLREESLRSCLYPEAKLTEADAIAKAQAQELVAAALRPDSGSHLSRNDSLALSQTSSLPNSAATGMKKTTLKCQACLFDSKAGSRARRV